MRGGDGAIDRLSRCVAELCTCGSLRTGCLLPPLCGRSFAAAWYRRYRAARWFRCASALRLSESSRSGWRHRCAITHLLALSRLGHHAIVRSPGVDLVLLMDGSTSMRCLTWRYSLAALDAMGPYAHEDVELERDRMALATFGHCGPQVASQGSNTILFFIDISMTSRLQARNDTS